MDRAEAEKRYEEQRPAYVVFVTRLRELIEIWLSESNIQFQTIEGRAKSLSSFVEKIERSGKNYEEPLIDISDLAGLRIILFYLNDIQKVTDIIRTNFVVDEERSSDKRDTMDPEEFGYQSIHMIVRLDAARGDLPEWRLYAGFVAEIQVRTVLQHAWAAISHKLQYKKENEIPRRLRRRLYRLSGLLELADDEFESLRDEQAQFQKKLVAALKQKKLDIEINRDSLLEYLHSNNNVTKLIRLATENGITVDVPVESWLSELLDLLGRARIGTITELDAFVRDLLASANRVIKYLSSSDPDSEKYMSVSFLLGLLLTVWNYDALSEALPDIGTYKTLLPNAHAIARGSQ